MDNKIATELGALVNSLERTHPKAELIAKKVCRVAYERKPDLLTHLIEQHQWFQVLVFTRTKHGADRLSKQLIQNGISSLAIHTSRSSRWF